MKRIALATIAFLAFAASAGAQVIPPGTNPVPGGCAYNTIPPTISTGQAAWVQCGPQGQMIVTTGGNGFAASQVTVATTQTQVAAARPGRNAVTITNTAAVDVYCGPTGVTTANGDLLVGTKGASKTYSTAAAIFCIVATGTEPVTVAESF